MLLVIVIIALAALAMIATFIELRRDGYRHIPTDWSRVGGYHPEPAERIQTHQPLIISRTRPAPDQSRPPRSAPD